MTFDAANRVFCCSDMTLHLKERDVALVYIAKFREYGIKILDGGTSFQEIGYCPWCGAKLEGSLRSEWFERLAQLGLEPVEDAIPEDMKTDAWWRDP